jgi:hypothetical protein
VDGSKKVPVPLVPLWVVSVASLLLPRPVMLEELLKKELLDKEEEPIEKLLLLEVKNNSVSDPCSVTLLELVSVPLKDTVLLLSKLLLVS